MVLLKDPAMLWSGFIQRHNLEFTEKWINYLTLNHFFQNIYGNMGSKALNIIMSARAPGVDGLSYLLMAILQACIINQEELSVIKGICENVEA